MRSIIPRSWMASFSGLLVLLTIVTSVLAQDLGILLDQSAYDGAERRVIYSSKLTFTRDVASLFTTKQLYALTSLAFTQMESKHRAQGIEQRLQPNMMVAMALGHDVYLSSSLKGGRFMYNDWDADSKPQIRLALDRCQARLQASRNAPYYMDDDVSVEARKWPPPTRVVAFGRGNAPNEAPTPNMVLTRDPDTAQNVCGKSESLDSEGFITWGCYHLMADEGIDAPQRPGKYPKLSLPDPFPEFTKKQISIIPRARP
ncbi:hypothetical protein C8035_v001281 [Colletotrichum spinosum]|uniref:Uncharacterized protein n=1 Tax=Colletotrichum spinosum TaxID=1347390 RepID=A0A4R8Q7Q0_9PEZI|nr:hypothetical protein C8035_v001281 [Colletotrichum spinosum]